MAGAIVSAHQDLPGRVNRNMSRSASTGWLFVDPFQLDAVFVANDLPSGKAVACRVQHIESRMHGQKPSPFSLSHQF